MLDQLNLWHLITLSLGVCIVIPYWVVATFVGRKQAKELQLFKQTVLQTRQKLLRELVYDGVTAAEEAGFVAKKAHQNLTATDKQQLVINHVLCVTDQFSEAEILQMIPATLAKVSCIGASNKTVMNFRS